MENEKCTYFAKIGGLWKVGATKQIDIRMNALATKHKCDIGKVFVYNVLNNFSLESYFKVRFSSKNVSGEFFDLSDNDVVFLSTFIPDESYNKMSKTVISELTGIDLKIERTRKRLSLRELSSKINKSIGWLSSVENDNIKVTPKIVCQYMDAIDDKD